MDITFAQRTDVGLKREDNQDSLGYFTSSLGRLFVVCDGMGGHAGGQVASQLAVQAIGERFEASVDGDDPETVLREGGEAANLAVIEEARGRPELEGMGTTAAMLLVRSTGDGCEAHIAHVGDSRVYLIRGSQMRQLTKDHTAVQRLVDQGVISSSQVSLHPQAGVISRTLGVDPDTEIDVRPDPIALEDEDVLLVCSDGLTTMVDDYDIFRYLNEYPLDAVPYELVSLCNARGGYDNVTLQVVQIGTPRVEQGPTESGMARLSDLLAEQEALESADNRTTLLVAAGALILVLGLVLFLLL